MCAKMCEVNKNCMLKCVKYRGTFMHLNALCMPCSSNVNIIIKQHTINILFPIYIVINV